MGVTEVIERGWTRTGRRTRRNGPTCSGCALLAAEDVLDRSTPVHVTGSALVVHPLSRRVLLRWHPRMLMWMQVGGHFDAGETDPWLVAVREAGEETGLPDLRLRPREPTPAIRCRS